MLMIPTALRPPALARLCTVLAVGLLLGLALARPARAEEPAVFLSWHAPFGQPGATDTLSAGCDSTRADTLWLAFNPGRKSATLLAVSATLMIRPVIGKALSASWSTDTLPGFNLRFCTPDADPVPGLGYPQPWKVNGVGVRSLEKIGGTMRYRVIYATPYPEAVSIDQKLYVLARIVVQRPTADDPRCGEPVSIEWSEVELGFSVGDTRHLKPGGPNRFVSLNSPGGEVSVPYRKAAALHGWNPEGAH